MQPDPIPPPLTHAEAAAMRSASTTINPRRPDCPAQLSPQGRYLDPISAGDGAVRQRLVDVYYCPSCACFVVVSEGVLLNEYGRPTLRSARRSERGAV